MYLHCLIDQSTMESKVHVHVQWIPRISRVLYIKSDIENREDWLLPGGHSSGGRALTAKVRGPWFNPRWLLVFQFSKNIPKPFHHVDT